MQKHKERIAQSKLSTTASKATTSETSEAGKLQVGAEDAKNQQMTNFFILAFVLLFFAYQIASYFD